MTSKKDIYKDYYHFFKETYLKNENKRADLIKSLINKHISGEEKFYIKEYKCSITNLIILQKNILNNKDNTKNNHRFLALKNLGGSSYMNATLQCLMNLKYFTNYLLNQNNFLYILQNKDKCEVIGAYCLLLQKLYCDENVINSYSPEEFKNIISLKNPLFGKNKEITPKNLILFLIREMNYELNQINLNIYQNLPNQFSINKNSEFINFIEEYSSENNNIISKLFSSIIENESLCSSCNTRKYDYEMIFYFDIPLEAIYNKIYGEQIHQNRKLNLIECISNFNEKIYFTGENAFYCNVCQKKLNSTCFKRIHSLSPYLIFILKRGKDNKFQCEFDFPEEINLQQYILNPQINYDYNLVGVITLSDINNSHEHFIAYCKNRTLNEWLCYNDEIVTKLYDQKNGYKNGIPYILFYESKQGDKNKLFENFENNVINNNFN